MFQEFNACIQLSLGSKPIFQQDEMAGFVAEVLVSYIIVIEGH